MKFHINVNANLSFKLDFSAVIIIPDIYLQLIPQICIIKTLIKNIETKAIFSLYIST